MIELWGIRVIKNDAWTGDRLGSWLVDARGDIMHFPSENLAGIIAASLPYDDGKLPPQETAYTPLPLPLVEWPDKYLLVALVEAVRFLAGVVGEREG